jgi:biopolymer transport protein ExbB
MIKKPTPRNRVALVSLATMLLAAPAALAQEAANAAASQDSALTTYVINGGPTMIFIGLATLALIALSVYNYIALSKPKFVPDDLRMALMDHMINCRVRSAIELAAGHPSYLGRMVAYALPNIDATRPDDLGREHVEDAMADFSINEQRKNMMWINYISLVAQAAPMLGLLGTVIGMVSAFKTLAVTGQAEPAALAGDISVALLTTMWGLITAIPALLAYYFFKARLGNLTSDAQHSVEEMLNASIQTVNQDAYLAKIPEGIAV